MKTNYWFVGLLALSLLAAGCGASKETLIPPAAVDAYGIATIDINWSETPAVGVDVTAQGPGLDVVAASIVYPQTAATLELAYDVSYDLFAQAKNDLGQVVAIGEAKGVVLTRTGNTPITFF